MDYQFFALTLNIIVGLVIALLAMPYIIRILRKKGYVVKDYYKLEKTLIPTNGAIIIPIMCFIVLLIFPVISYSLWRINKLLFHIEIFEQYYTLTPIAQMAVLVVALYGLFGLIDDYLHITHKTKILIPLLFAIPLMSPMYESVFVLPFFGIVDNTTVCTLPWGGDFKIINLYRLLFVPVAVMVVANLSNMHSGFNGLQSGLSAIILSFLIAKSVYVGRITDIIGLGAIAGAIIGFWWFNRYPARVFDGNVGALSMGAAIGVVIVVQGFIISGFIMLIPHIADFFMYFYIRIKGYKFIKFGKVRKDGTIDAPNPLKLKFLFPYYFRLTEKQTVHILYALTIIFCVIGFFVPY